MRPRRFIQKKRLEREILKNFQEQKAFKSTTLSISETVLSHQVKVAYKSLNAIA